MQRAIVRLVALVSFDDSCERYKSKWIKPHKQHNKCYSSQWQPFTSERSIQTESHAVQLQMYNAGPKAVIFYSWSWYFWSVKFCIPCYSNLMILGKLSLLVRKFQKYVKNWPGNWRLKRLFNLLRVQNVKTTENVKCFFFFLFLLLILLTENISKILDKWLASNEMTGSA